MQFFLSISFLFCVCPLVFVRLMLSYFVALWRPPLALLPHPHVSHDLILSTCSRAKVRVTPRWSQHLSPSPRRLPSQFHPSKCCTAQVCRRRFQLRMHLTAHLTSSPPPFRRRKCARSRRNTASSA